MYKYIIAFTVLTGIIMVTIGQFTLLNTSIEHIQYEVCPPVRKVSTEGFSTSNQNVALQKTNSLADEFIQAWDLAFAYFPELTNVNIQLKHQAISTTMQARPDMKSFFGKTRSYSIYINNDPDFDGIHFEDIPFNAKVGIICHELGHILDYEQKSKTQIINIGLQFLSKPGRASFEKSIDYLIILKGCGWQLYDWADYAMNHSSATEDYKAFKRQNYLQPFEILSIMESLSLYD